VLSHQHQAIVRSAPCLPHQILGFEATRWCSAVRTWGRCLTFRSKHLHSLDWKPL